MERHLSREGSPLGRWAALCRQAGHTAPLLALLSLACGTASRPEAEHPPLHRAPPDEIIVRTDHFAFHMGARVDETWPTKADETRAALGRAVEVLLEEEETTVTVLSKQLGVEFPREALDFDVAMTADEQEAPCESGLPRRLEMTMASVVHPEPVLFFACVLERAFLRLSSESALARAMGAADAGRGRLYACVVRYAVGAMLVSRVHAHETSAARRLELGLAEGCGEKELDWLGREWVKRVRGEESAEDFGARARKEGER